MPPGKLPADIFVSSGQETNGETDFSMAVPQILAGLQAGFLNNFLIKIACSLLLLENCLHLKVIYTKHRSQVTATGSINMQGKRENSL